MGLFTSPNNASIMGAAPGQQAGMASGVLNMTRGLGTALGLAVTGSIFAGGGGRQQRNERAAPRSPVTAYVLGHDSGGGGRRLGAARRERHALQRHAGFGRVNETARWWEAGSLSGRDLENGKEVGCLHALPGRGVPGDGALPQLRRRHQTNGPAPTGAPSGSEVTTTPQRPERREGSGLRSGHPGSPGLLLAALVQRRADLR